MQHELLVVLADQRVDHLLVRRRAERRRRQRLRLAAGEQRRAVRARQDPDLAADRADVGQAAAVEAALLRRRSCAAHDALLRPSSITRARSRASLIGKLAGGSPTTSARLASAQRRRAPACRRTRSPGAMRRQASASTRVAQRRVDRRRRRPSRFGLPTASRSSSCMSRMRLHLGVGRDTARRASRPPAGSWRRPRPSRCCRACRRPPASARAASSLRLRRVDDEACRPMRPTRTAAIGPRNGMSETCSAAEAPISARTSGSFSLSSESTVAMTCVS